MPSPSPRLLMRMQRARPIEPWRAPELYQALARLARRAGLDAVPELYWHPARIIAAFTVGRDAAAAIALSDGGPCACCRSARSTRCWSMRWRMLPPGDTGLMQWTAVLHRLTVAIALFWLLLTALVFLVGGVILSWLPLAFAASPWLVLVLQRALSRGREFAADARGGRTDR